MIFHSSDHTRKLHSFPTLRSSDLGLSNSADTNLSLETNHTSNIALEFALYDQRIYGTIEYFNRDSRDLLQSVPISRVTGSSSTLKNSGSINNKGIELDRKSVV